MNYDLNGNLVCISGPVACAARGDDFIYSAENQLLRAYGPDADYSYDPAARRVRKDVAGVVTDFLHAGAMEIAEYGASGTLLRRYIPGPGVDQRIAMIECGAGGGAAACAPGGAGVATRYYFADRQGNVLALANQDGTLAQQFFYTPFGVELVGNAGENPFRYTGRRFDPETGLYYYRARYYDADLGRFLQVDPVGYADQWNLYAYVGNNPLNATDPTGEAENELELSAELTVIVGVRAAIGLELHRPSAAHNDNTPWDLGIRLDIGPRAGANAGVSLAAASNDSPGSERESLRGMMAQADVSALIVSFGGEAEIRSLQPSSGGPDFVDPSSGANVNMNWALPRPRIRALSAKIGASEGIQFRTGFTLREAFSFFSGNRDEANDRDVTTDMPATTEFDMND